MIADCLKAGLATFAWVSNCIPSHQLALSYVHTPALCHLQRIQGARELSRQSSWKQHCYHYSWLVIVANGDKC